MCNGKGLIFGEKQSLVVAPGVYLSFFIIKWGRGGICKATGHACEMLSVNGGHCYYYSLFVFIHPYLITYTYNKDCSLYFSLCSHLPNFGGQISFKKSKIFLYYIY